MMMIATMKNSAAADDDLGNGDDFDEDSHKDAR